LRDLASLVVKTGLRKTKADVRRLVPQNGLNVNGQIITTEDEVIKATGALERLLHNKYLIVKVGKKSFALVEVTD
jgi:tyrosyl-tRNA synthetase